jgi:hypothetical protein
MVITFNNIQLVRMIEGLAGRHRGEAGNDAISLDAAKDHGHIIYYTSETRFYQASFLDIPPVNYGGQPVTADAFSAIESVSRPPTMIWTQMSPEMNNIIPGHNSNSISKQSIGIGVKVMPAPLA